MIKPTGKQAPWMILRRPGAFIASQGSADRISTSMPPMERKRPAMNALTKRLPMGILCFMGPALIQDQVACSRVSICEDMASVAGAGAYGVTAVEGGELYEWAPDGRASLPMDGDRGRRGVKADLWESRRMFGPPEGSLGKQMIRRLYTLSGDPFADNAWH